MALSRAWPSRRAFSWARAPSSRKSGGTMPAAALASARSVSWSRALAKAAMRDRAASTSWAVFTGCWASRKSGVMA
ncbi:hypothetical protein D3C80_1691280 [compost metagenome]